MWLGGAVLAHVPDAVAWHDGPDVTGRVDAGAQQSAEAIRLAHLIPVEGSRPRGLRPAKADVVVADAIAEAGEAERFVSMDAVLAAVRGAEPETGDPAREDRVRLRIDILRPCRVDGPDLAELVARIGREGWGTVTVVAEDTDILRITSLRAHTRARRWERDDLFPTLRLAVDGVTLVEGAADVEAYLGGWG